MINMNSSSDDVNSSEVRTENAVQVLKAVDLERSGALKLFFQGGEDLFDKFPVDGLGSLQPLRDVQKP